MKKVFFTLSVLVLCCCYVWAFPRSEKSPKVSSSGSVNESLWQEATEEASKPLAKESKESEKKLKATEELWVELKNNSQETVSKFKELEQNTKASKKELSAAISEAAELEEDYKQLQADYDELKDASNAGRFYADGGVVLTTKDDKVQTGVTVGGGVIFSSGLKVGAYAQIFPFDTGKWGNKTSIAVTAGWVF